MIFELVRVSICKEGKGSGIHSITIASLDFRFIVPWYSRERKTCRECEKGQAHRIAMECEEHVKDLMLILNHLPR